jgi:uncharacterized protein YbjT (DUF2867 family)
MILVTGATGFIGQALVRRLVDSSWPVQVLLPQGNRSRKVPFPDSVQLISGLLSDPETLHRAMIGVHTVFHLASAQWWGHRRDLERIDLAGTRSIITAARSARIGRINIVSHLGASPSSAFILMRVKGQVEEAVRTSGIAYTVFRSGVVFGRGDSFVNNLAMALRANPAVFFQPGQGENLIHPIYIDDLVSAMVNSLENLNTVDQTLEIGGPEYVSFNEMIRTVMRVTDTSKVIVAVPPYVLRAMTGAINRVVPRWPMTPQWLDILAENRTAPLRNLPDTFGIRPVRFEDTIVTYMRNRRWLPELLRTMIRRHPQQV